MEPYDEKKDYTNKEEEYKRTNMEAYAMELSDIDLLRFAVEVISKRIDTMHQEQTTEFFQEYNKELLIDSLPIIKYGDI